jgi:dipeptidyl aminopeptidase/acylaminoacyl peptidase
VPALAVAAASLALAAVPAAHAAFPGANGRLSFTSDRDANGNIFSVDPAGTDLVRLTVDPADDAQSAWSPDGSRVAFRSRRDGHYEVYVMNADGSGQTRLTTTIAGTASNPPSSSQPSWSPDGRRLLFRSNRAGHYDVWVMNADGSDPRALTDDAPDDRYPGFSPDGTRIVFRSDRDGDPEIWTLAAGGGDLRQLTFNDRFDSAPAWSPDGTRIAFERALDPTIDNQATAEIHVMQADGSGAVALTSNQSLDEGPAWSPDGTRIAFTSTRDGNSEIYVMRADGSEPTRLTAAASVEESPDWQALPAGTTPTVPGTTPPPADDVPVLSRLSLDPRRFAPRRRGRTPSVSERTLVRYSLSIAARVTFAIEVARSGVRRGGRCVRRRSGRRRTPRCTRYVRLPQTFVRTGRAGDNSLSFAGRPGGRVLAAGRYRLVATPRTATGKAGRGARASFRILR